MKLFKHPDIQKIFLLLNKNKQNKILFVGGCVRDFVLGLPIKDIDMATIYSPQEITKILSPHFKVIPTGIEHGTVTVLTGAGAVQVTTLRHDVKTDGRRAIIAFTDDWAADAARRDFTINTLLMDGRGNIIDPLSVGAHDLVARRVKFVGDASWRVREDYLRILRYVRFQARFGKGGLSKQYLEIFKAERIGFQKLSRERVTDEILKIIMLPRGLRFLQEFYGTKILPLPHISDESVQSHKKLINLEALTLPRALVLLANFKMSGWTKIKAYLKLSNAQIDSVEMILSSIKFVKQFSVREYQLLLYKYGVNAAMDIVIMAAVKHNKTKNFIQKQMAILNVLPVPVFPVTGKALLAQGWTAGKNLGDELKRLEMKWIQSGFKSAPL